ncbi:MAG: heat shock protein transcriptional repressor HspR [Actinomycetales bacterium]
MPTHFDENAPVFVISVAAELAGMHPQTLRQYDRLGLVTPSRSSGKGRRYSARDIAVLREVQRLSQEEGVNLAGVKRILELELQVEALQHKVRELSDDLLAAYQAMQKQQRVFAAGASGDVVAMRPGSRPERTGSRGEVVLWRSGR